MEIPSRITKKQLLDFSQEHLYYEIAMLIHMSQLLVDKKYSDYYYFSAILESFVVHSCNLLDFFYRPQIKPDDASALHYIKDKKAWYAGLPPREKHFKAFHKKRNREVMHLSYKRLEIPPEKRPWSVVKITKEIRKILDCFLDCADPELLHARVFEFRLKKKK